MMGAGLKFWAGASICGGAPGPAPAGGPGSAFASLARARSALRAREEGITGGPYSAAVAMATRGWGVAAAATGNVLCSASRK